MGCFDCCAVEKRPIVYLVGSKAHKDTFLEKVLGLPPKEKHFHEYRTTAQSQPLIIQSCELGKGLKEIDDMYSKVSTSVVYLTDTDEPVNSDNPTLFILFGRKSKQASEGNLIVASITNDSYTEARGGFGSLIKKIRK